MSVLQTMEDVVTIVLTQRVVIYAVVKVDGNWTPINIPVKVGEIYVRLLVGVTIPFLWTNGKYR